MRAFTAALTATALLTLGAFTADAGQWYIGVSGGGAAGPALDMNGHNLDTVRYPDWDYTGVPANQPEGYRWSYFLETDTGSSFEAVIGRMLYSEGEGGARIEAALSRRTQAIEQVFNPPLTFLDGTPVKPNNSGVTAVFESTIGDLVNDAALLNLCYDIPVGDSAAVYLGGGAGLTIVNITDLYFKATYMDADGSPLDQYNSSQATDFSGTALTGNMVAGVDYRVAEGVFAGVKAAYTIIDKIEPEGSYLEHPMKYLKSTTVFSGNRQWSFAVALKYVLSSE